jgi:hypothetical protein
LADPVRGNTPYQTISTDDIGGFVALAFERPKEFIGLELEIAGSELTNLQAAEVFSRVLNRPVKFQRLIVRLFLGKESYQMFHRINSEGNRANISELRRKYPEVRLHTWKSGSAKADGTSAGYVFGHRRTRGHDDSRVGGNTKFYGAALFRLRKVGHDSCAEQGDLAGVNGRTLRPLR